jgi:hypothetical protein
LTGAVNMSGMPERPVAAVIDPAPDMLSVPGVDVPVRVWAGTSTAKSCGDMPVPAPVKRYNQDAALPLQERK